MCVLATSPIGLASDPAALSGSTSGPHLGGTISFERTLVESRGDGLRLLHYCIGSNLAACEHNSITRLLALADFAIDSQRDLA